MDHDQHDLRHQIDAITPTLPPLEIGAGDVAERRAVHRRRILIDCVTRTEMWPATIDGCGEDVGWVIVEAGQSPYSPIKPRDEY